MSAHALSRASGEPRTTMETGSPVSKRIRAPESTSICFTFCPLAPMTRRTARSGKSTPTISLISSSSPSTCMSISEAWTRLVPRPRISITVFTSRPDASTMPSVGLIARSCTECACSISRTRWEFDAQRYSRCACVTGMRSVAWASIANSTSPFATSLSCSEPLITTTACSRSPFPDLKRALASRPSLATSSKLLSVRTWMRAPDSFSTSRTTRPSFPISSPKCRRSISMIIGSAPSFSRMFLAKAMALARCSAVPRTTIAASGVSLKETWAPLSRSRRLMVRPPTPMSEPCLSCPSGRTSSSIAAKSALIMASTRSRAACEPMIVIVGGGVGSKLIVAPHSFSTCATVAPLRPMRRRTSRIEHDSTPRISDRT
mmetsp:Transcript_6304/g.15272  ORF Transcript_6304/g.15272 Transcript_6304/m.15272 type:complete len:374 (-) Transcript_6304:1447-2568(-)